MRVPGWLLAMLLLGHACPLLAAGELASEDAAKPTNLVVILVDDLGWNDVGYHGSELATPHIDALAREGLALDRFYTYPACRPSRATLLTGRTTASTRVMARAPLSLALPTLADVLHGAGYQTWMAGKWSLGGRKDTRRLPHQRGFDAFYGHLGGAIDYFTHRSRESGELDWWRNDEPVVELGYSTRLLAAQAIRWIEQRDPTRPFFLYLAFNAVHGPLQAPEATRAAHADAKNSKRSRFAALLAELDAAVGRVVAAIDGAGLRERTLVVFLSDNGGAPRTGSRNVPLRSGKLTLYEGGLRVPAVLRQPGVLPAGQTSRQLIWLADLFPTLQRALGIEGLAADAFEGVDLWAALQREPPSPRPPFVVEFNDRALIGDRWKLIEPREGKPMLFDLIDDPGEQKDLATVRRQLVHRLRTELRDASAVASERAKDTRRPAPPVEAKASGEPK